MEKLFFSLQAFRSDSKLERFSEEFMPPQKFKKQDKHIKL